MPDRIAVNKNKNKWLIAKNILFAVAFVMVAAINDSPDDKVKVNNERKPNMVKTSKLAALMGGSLSKHTKKLTVPMVTNITSNQQEIDEGEVFTLTGTFSANQPMSNVSVKWVLPPEVQVINGSKNSFLSQVEAGKDYLFELNLKAVSNIDQIIHLVAESKVGDSSFSNSSQFHTKLQQVMKESYQRLHERTLEYAKENER